MLVIILAAALVVAVTAAVMFASKNQVLGNNLLEVNSEIETLKELLSMYLPEGGGDPGRLTAARRRIAGIEEVSLLSDTRLVRGSLVRGYIVRLKLRLDYYASAGDLMLFGELLSPFFAGLVGLNSFVTLVVADPVSGEQFEWPTLLAPDLML